MQIDQAHQQVLWKKQKKPYNNIDSWSGSLVLFSQGMGGTNIKKVSDNKNNTSELEEDEMEKDNVYEEGI